MKGTLKAVRFITVPFAFILISYHSKAQVSNADTIIQNKSFWNSKALKISAVPMAFFTGAALTWGARKDIRKLRNRYLPSFRHHYDDYTQYIPALSVFALNAAGVKGKHSIKRSVVSYALSMAIMAATVNAIKYTSKVQRPGGGNEFNSFPSGHTATSFANATFLHKEYGQYRHPLYSVGGYTLATATAVGRQLNNRHWISDVLAGAGVGILSTEVAYIIADKIFKGKGECAPLGFNPRPIQLKPSFLEIKGGFAHATSKDITGRSADIYAKQGVNLGIEGAWFFHKNIGVGGAFAFSSFPVNGDNYRLLDYPDIEMIGDGYYTQPMGIRYLHAGPFFSYPLPHNWFVTGKLNAGSSEGAEGSVLLKLKDEYQEDFELSELPLLKYKPKRAFSWAAELGLQKRIGNNLAIKLYAGYLNSRNKFVVDELDGIDEDWNYTYQSFSQNKLKYNHITAGLALTAFLW